MPETVALISAESIDQEEFFHFANEYGAAPISDDEFVVERNEGAIWVSLSVASLPEALAVSDGQIARRLDGEARSCCLITISRRDGSERIAMEFAVAFMKRWPSVLYDYREDVFHREQLCEKLARYESLLAF